MNNTHHNVDEKEIAQFEALANHWWNPEGEMKPLHLLNPLRLQYIQNHVHLSHQRVLDVGCGGGLLSEAMARAGADVTGIDLSPALLDVARHHAEREHLPIHYQYISIEDLSTQAPASFDVITCMELLEHVPDPCSIVRSAALLLKPGGHIFFATINRNVKSYLLAIVGAEYILNLLPKGTHHYAQLIRPAELTRFARQARLQLQNLTGLRYYWREGYFTLCQDVSVNYLAYFQKTMHPDEKT